MIGKLLTVLMMLGMLGSVSAMSGCNTIAGAGTDIERGGQKIHDEASEVQRRIQRSRNGFRLAWACRPAAAWPGIAAALESR